MNEDECKAKAKEMFGDDMCKNTPSYGTDECDGVSTIGQATDRPPGCYMFQNQPQQRYEGPQLQSGEASG